MNKLKIVLMEIKPLGDEQYNKHSNIYSEGVPALLYGWAFLSSKP